MIFPKEAKTIAGLQNLWHLFGDYRVFAVRNCKRQYAVAQTFRTGCIWLFDNRYRRFRLKMLQCLTNLGGAVLQ